MELPEDTDNYLYNTDEKIDTQISTGFNVFYSENLDYEALVRRGWRFQWNSPGFSAQMGLDFKTASTIDQTSWDHGPALASLNSSIFCPTVFSILGQ